MFDQLHKFLFVDVTDAVGNIILLHKHLVTLEDVALPEELLELRESFEDLHHEGLLHLHDFSHRVGSGFGVVDVGEQRFEAEDLSGKHGLFVDHILVGELNDAAALLHEVEIFCDFGIIHDSLVRIEGESLAKFVRNQLENGVRKLLEKFVFLQDGVEVGFLPLGREQVEFKRFAVDDMIKHIVFVGL